MIVSRDGCCDQAAGDASQAAPAIAAVPSRSQSLRAGRIISLSPLFAQFASAAWTSLR